MADYERAPHARRRLRNLALVGLVCLVVWALLTWCVVSWVSASEPAWPTVCRVIQPEDLDRYDR
jgi:hypothetical protein